MESSHKKMRPALKATIVFLCIAVLLTLFSKTLYNMNIPVVKVVEPIRGNMNRLYEAQSVVSPNETVNIFAPSALTVSDIMVQEKKLVKTGDPLVSFDVSDMESELLDLQDDHEKLVMQRKHTYGREPKQLLEMDIDAVERDIESLENKISKCRQVVSPVDGFIVELNVSKGQLVSQSEPLMVVTDMTAGYGATVVMPADVALGFFAKGNVGITQVNMEVRGVTKQGEIASLAWTKEMDTAVLVKPERPDELDLTTGDPVNLTFTQTTLQQYSFMVPREVLQGEHGNYYVYRIDKAEGVLGEEYIAHRVNVKIADQNDELVALSGNLHDGEQFMISSDKEVSEGRVRLYHAD